MGLAEAREPESAAPLLLAAWFGSALVSGSKSAAMLAVSGALALLELSAAASEFWVISISLEVSETRLLSWVPTMDSWPVTWADMVLTAWTSSRLDADGAAAA